LFAAVKERMDEIMRAEARRDASDNSIAGLRQRTADLISALSAVDGFEKGQGIGAIKAALREAPAGDPLLLRTLARRHKDVLHALARATRKTICVLFFEPLPYETEGCGDCAAGDWATGEDVCPDSGVGDPKRRQKGVYPHWAVYDSTADGGNDPDHVPASATGTSGEHECMAAGSSSDPGSVIASGGICLLHLYDHHFDLLGLLGTAPGEDGKNADTEDDDTVRTPEGWEYARILRLFRESRFLSFLLIEFLQAAL
jgi:hypothetical protein